MMGITIHTQSIGQRIAHNTIPFEGIVEVKREPN